MNKTFLFFACLLSINISQAQTWGKLGTGTSGLMGIGNGVYTMCSDRNGNMYVAGWFRAMNIDTSWNVNVYKWDGSSWSELGTGATALNANSQIQVLCSDSSGNIYAGGEFTNDSGNEFVAKWDGTSWTELGGMNALHANANVLSICSDKNGYIYAAGAFTDGSSDTSGHSYVAKWDGTSWCIVLK